MLDKLSGYLEINQINNPDAFVAVGEYIICNPEKKIKNVATKGYILDGFQQLVNNCITLEQFLLLGDMGYEDIERAPIDIHARVPREDAVSYIATILKLDESNLQDTIVVANKRIRHGHQDLPHIEAELEKRNSKLLYV